MSLLRLSALAAFISLPLSSIALPMYTLVELPTVGFSYAQPYAINNSGIAVGRVPFGGPPYQAFSSNGSTMINVGASLGVGGGSHAYDVNNLGQIVGVGGSTGAFLYDNGVVTELPILGGLRSWAFGINDLGWVVGVSEDSRQTNQGFIYKDGGISQLENLFPNRPDATSSAKAINNSGVVIGSSNGSAVYWSNSGVISALTGSFGGASVVAEAINDAGQIVGYADYASPSTAHGAFIWESGVMTDLGNLGGIGGAAATSINSAGHVVGSASRPDGSGSGFIWTAQDGIVALDTLLDPAFSSWQILQGQGINDSDQIVAYARASEGSPWTIVILSPIATEAIPAPATPALLLVGLLSFFAMKRTAGKRPSIWYCGRIG